jgi:putative hydrolase of the HAD superfamily
VDISEKQIKNIIFDLGGVLLNIDYNLLVKAFANIGLPHFEDYFTQKSQRDFFDLYEKGLISSEEFRKKIKEKCAAGTTDAEIDAAWNSMLLDFPKHRLELLLKLKGRYRTFLLSNTNEIHMNYIHSYLEKAFQMPDFSKHFEKVHLSYNMRMRKPDAEIFQAVLRQNNLEASETLFIDDSVQHVESATKLGIQTYWLDVKKEDITTLFKEA